MGTGLASYKIYRSFRLEIPPVDPITFELLTPQKMAIVPRDLNLSGLSFYSPCQFNIHQELELELSYISWFRKKTINLKGFIVRKFSHPDSNSQTGHGVMIAKDDREKLALFIEDYVSSFSAKRLRQYLTDSTLAEKSYSMADALEVYSLYLSLIQDLSEFMGPTHEKKISLMRQAMKSSAMVAYLFDSETQTLRPMHWDGDTDRPQSVHYLEGLPGMTLGSGETFNFTSTFNRLNGHFFATRPNVMSCLSTPLYNKKREPIGVLQAINKIGSPQFNESDEASLQLFARVFEEFYASLNGVPQNKLSELIPGESQIIKAVCQAANKLKETLSPTLITGEKGLGKTKLAKWMHENGQFAQHEMVYFEQDSEEVLATLTQMIKTQATSTIIWKNLLLTPKSFQTKAFELLREHAGKSIFIERSLPDAKLSLWDAPLIHFMTRSHIHLPPLRARPEDIVPNAHRLLLELCQKNSLGLKIFSKKTIECLQVAQLPGNLDELREYVMKDFNAQLSDQIIDLTSLYQAELPPTDVATALLMASDSTLALSKRMSMLKHALERVDTKGKKVS